MSLSASLSQLHFFKLRTLHPLSWFILLLSLTYHSLCRLSPHPYLTPWHLGQFPWPLASATLLLPSIPSLSQFTPLVETCDIDKYLLLLKEHHLCHLS